METNDNMNKLDGSGNRIQNSNSGRVIGGIVLLLVGSAFFAREAGVYLPYWLFSWPMVLVVVGLYLGGRHSFKLGGWIAPLLIGIFFLADNILEDMHFDFGHLLWPSLLVAAGLYMIFKPRKIKGEAKWEKGTISSEDAIDETAIFGGSKRNIISKNFKGGEITTIFGGTDLNFTQSDIQGTIVIDSTTMFGGIKLIVPAHWNLKSEVVCIFGGIDDKRSLSTAAIDPTKTLVLKGTCIFGGIDIKSH